MNIIVNLIHTYNIRYIIIYRYLEKLKKLRDMH